MIGIIDYGAGNLLSVSRALERLGLAHAFVRSAAGLKPCARLLLPGVGHFGAAVGSLRRLGLFAPLRRWLQDGRPFLGICLGMQLLFAASEEAPGAEGLALFPGTVRAFTGRPRLQIGWNRVRIVAASPLWARRGAAFYYFVNGYRVAGAPREILAATGEFQGEFAAAVARGPVCGVQFHPEKSGDAGLRLLRRWGAS